MLAKCLTATGVCLSASHRNLSPFFVVMLMSSDVRSVTVKLAKLADTYERVHYIGHIDYSPDVIADDFKKKAGEILNGCIEKTGYICFLRDIQVRQFPPKQTDVDFIIDSPSESPIAPIIIAAIIAAILIATAVIVYVVWKWWTVWVEKVRQYICEQCPDYPTFDGWDAYMGHLKEKHPEKYEGALEAAKVGAGNWWEGVAMVGIIGLLLIAAIVVLPKVIPKRRE